MKIGVVFPQTEIGEDPAAIRDYAQAVEALGHTHILAFDSVVGANPDRPGGWDSQYTYRHAFHEPFVLFAFCAAVTRRIELVKGVLILPSGRRRSWPRRRTVAPGTRRRHQAPARPAADPRLDGRRERGGPPPRLPPRRRLDHAADLPPRPRGAADDRPAPRPRPGRGPRSRRVRHRGARGPGAGSLGGAREEDGRVARVRGITHLCVNTMGLGLPSPEEHVRTLERFKTDTLG